MSSTTPMTEPTSLCERLRLYSIALTLSMRSAEEREYVGDLRVGPHMAAEALVEAADLIERLGGALEKATFKLRRCMAVSGNADFAIDACCEEFDQALAAYRKAGEVG